MKLNELKCDLCEKNKKFLNNNSETNNLNKPEEADETSKANSSTIEQAEQNQNIVAKCVDCNYFLCSTCFVDHQIIGSFANHQIINLNKNKDEREPEEIPSDLQNKQSNTSSSSNKPNTQNNQLPMSNLAQLQQHYNTLQDQVLVQRKRDQQMQQKPEVFMLGSQQQQQQQRLLQIETEIQKSYNFYTQMLKERKDYLINELNTIVQYAVLNHSQNYNKQLKLKAELEQKRHALELSDSVQSFLNPNETSKASPLNDMNCMRDTNNNKISSNLVELNNLTMINNQIISQLKANNPLMQIEFVSNYSAIQTSIRNTFGYIRINNQLNAQNGNSQVKPEMNNLNGSNSVYDYLSQMNNKRPKGQNELYVDLESSALQSGQFYNMNRNGLNNEVGNEVGFDYFGNTTNNNNQMVNTFSASSTSSSKSTNSSIATNGSSFSNNQNNTIQKLQQKPIGTSQSYDSNGTSPISISTDTNNGQANTGLLSNSSISSSNYLFEQFGKDWSNPNGINELIQKAKQSENDGEINHLLNEDFFNSTMVRSKNSWSSIVSSNENEIKRSDDVVMPKDLFSPYFNESFEPAKEQQNSPMLTALLNGNKTSYDKLGINKFNNNSITLSAGSVKSTTSSSGNFGNSYFNNKVHGQVANDDQMLLSNNMNGQKMLSSSSSTSASPDDRVSSLSSSNSSTSSESNFHDSSLATLKSDMKSTSNTNNSLMGNLGQLSVRSMMVDQHSSSNNSASLAVGSATRSQLRRSKMIYHCKFGEFGINDGQFTEPSGVTINTNNDIIVADTNSHRIQIFDKDGRFKFKFGECGKRDGQLLYPNRVSVVKHTGDIVVTERSPTHQIQIYNKYGQFLRKFGANILQHPRGVCVDNKGRIIVVECKVMRVLIFDLMGNVLQKFNCSKYLEFPNGVCCSSGLDREEIYISDNRAHCIKVFDYMGNFIRQIGGEGITNYPIGVGINSNNEILVADNHNNFNLTVFSQDGQLINALESKVKHAQCFDVGLMDDGSIVLASKDYRIYVYKYVNNNLSLSDHNMHLVNNTNSHNEFNFEQREIHTDEQLYDLFSPQMSDLTNYNQLMGLAGGSTGQFANVNNQSFAKSKSSENLLENLNTFNCLMSN